MMILDDPMLAEDVIQEAFYKIISISPTIKHSSNFNAWITKVTKNTAYDMLRKGKIKLNIYLSDISEVKNFFAIENSFALESTDLLVEKKIRNEILMSLLDNLKYDYKIVLYLHYIKDLSYQEIADKLGISQNVLRQRLVRARKKLAYNFSILWSIETNLL